MKNLVKIGFVILSSVLAYQTKADIPVRYPSLVKYESNGVCGLKNHKGEVITLAIYDEIEPYFDEGGFARAVHCIFVFDRMLTKKLYICENNRS